MSRNTHSTIANYLFQTIEGYKDAYPAKSKALAIPNDTLDILCDAMNALAHDLGHDAVFTFTDYTMVTPEFAYAVRDLFTNINRSLNPLNSGIEHKKRVTDGSYHEILARFYDNVSRFLNEADVPLERGKEEVSLPHKRQDPVLLKYSFDIEGDTPVQCMTEVDHISQTGKPVICFGGTAGVQGNPK